MTPSSPPPTRYTLDDFDFALPPELVAQHPAAERSASRLLDGTGAVPRDLVFRDLPGLLRAGDLLVVNDTRVVKARLLGAKADVNQADANGWTALICAAAGDVTVVNRLIDAGADVGRSTKDGLTALKRAKASGHAAVAGTLEAAAR